MLVVIGILIALQINDANDMRKERMREVSYLENIKTDLKIDIQEMNRYLAIRTGCIEAAQRILTHFEEYLNNLKLKNGFSMTVLEFGTMNNQMRMMKQLSEELTRLIDKEIDQ